MPYLNWTQIAADIQTSAHPRLQTQLSLCLTQADLATLLVELAAIWVPGSTEELRVDFPKGWTVFWKQRDTESRLLLAHPDKDAWVATAAIAAGDSLTVLNAFKALTSSSTPAAIGDLVTLSGFSNLEISI